MFYRLVRIDAMKGNGVQSWVLNLPALVGRGEGAAVHIDDESISRTHCELLLGVDEGLLVRDHGSTNGTYVNGERIRKTHSLVPGDTLQIGSVTLKIEYTSDTDPGRPAKKPATYSTATTQPMRTLRPDTFQYPEPPKPEKRWWEFWKD